MSWAWEDVKEDCRACKQCHGFVRDVERHLSDGDEAQAADLLARRRHPAAAAAVPCGPGPRRAPASLGGGWVGVCVRARLKRGAHLPAHVSVLLRHQLLAQLIESAVADLVLNAKRLEQALEGHARAG